MNGVAKQSLLEIYMEDDIRMDEQKFLNEMMDLLDTEDEITMESILEEIEEWDSLSFVSFLATMSEWCSKRIPPIKVREAKTIGDLFLLVHSR